MNKRVTDIVAYLSWPGLLVAFLVGDRHSSRFHINQSLVIWIAGTLVGILWKLICKVAWVPLLGWSMGLLGALVCGAAGLFCTLCWFIGFINACQGIEKDVPLLGQIQLL